MAASARRSLTSNLTTLLTRRFHPSFSHLIPHNRDQNSPPSPPRGASPITGVSFLFGFARSYSSAPGDSGNVGFAKDVAGVVHGTGAADVAPVVGEVAAAAADSAPPVAAVQYFMDAVHSFTGLDWWITIAATTLLIRSATVPLMVYQLKASSKLALLKPEIEKIKAEMDNSADPETMKSHQTRIKKLFKDHGVSPFTPLKGMLIQGPVFISFYFAISNMVEKVPSFREGGAFWFTDLTTPDPFYALPILTGLTFLVNVELNMQEGMEGNPMAGNMKKFSRLMAFLTVPFTASFPKAIFCYWITSNIFSLAYGTVIRRPAVRKYLQIPVATAKPAAASPQSFPFSGTSKQIEPNAPPSTLTTQRPQNREKRISSSAVISQRIRNLERSVKAKNKKKR